MKPRQGSLWIPIKSAKVVLFMVVSPPIEDEVVAYEVPGDESGGLTWTGHWTDFVRDFVPNKLIKFSQLW